MIKVLINDGCTKFIPFSKIEYFEIIKSGNKGFMITAKTFGETHIIEFRETQAGAMEYLTDILKGVDSV